VDDPRYAVFLTALATLAKERDELIDKLAKSVSVSGMYYEWHTESEEKLKEAEAKHAAELEDIRKLARQLERELCDANTRIASTFPTTQPRPE